MVTLELPDRTTLNSFIADRRAKGLDGPDEVWEGTYIVMPNPGNEHQAITTQLAHVFKCLVDDSGLGHTLDGCNVSDREEDWTENYRCPDSAVFLKGNHAKDRKSHWLGGPDLAVEVISRGDRARQKLEFYAAVGVRELVVIDRDPWRIELYRPTEDTAGPVAVTLPGGDPVETTTVPMRWSLGVANGDRPAVRLEAGEKIWTA